MVVKTPNIFTFQFHMVRLKAYQKLIELVIYQNFNSTMVRLKGGSGLARTECYWISIPLWFD